MLISAQYLVDRLRHPRSRADEVAALRRRFAAAPVHDGGPSGLSVTERDLALELRRLREALSVALAGVASCSGCARGHPLPHGRWRGGHCCGTRGERLSPPAGDHAGCAFRGPDGCSLAPADRPSLCVRYICRELEG